MKSKQRYGITLLLVLSIHNNDALCFVTRRQMASRSSVVPFFWLLGGSPAFDSASVAANAQTEEGFPYAFDWTGTRLTWMDIDTASQSASWTMGRWPDPTLRRVARPVQSHWFGTSALQRVATLLEETAVVNDAVGLAAQQCGVDARMVYLDTLSSKSRRNKSKGSSLIMVNPNIVERSPEADMRVWNEFCLVLPPAFRATVLRDAWIVVEFQDVTGAISSMKLQGETARAAQHELDHDRGILTLDHIGIEEMETDVMRSIEKEGHDKRQQLAFSRAVIEPFGA